ncbi:conserved hypothetical protein [Gluconacetobacter diazotrophicus PA1 5]|uniref:Uncharacterized protein n=2 Tax=Gluconacetobacter diazotrophicus TaxID=33996 RepID=A9HHC8_GLUDA|nr:hypothetical protein [Gluconacetobacter diazotrophicus]ACI53185.1 conserved hypothetical protein [Gluconacetobacter diazotrophicus PA1 5]MBB2156064.1 hypothetical protein [Gluconacetobacter diazotrophicus]TWB10441.1 flagellar assembly protein FliH [Gluconacetobacter diazotrophicus]CAP55621.1 hypothetical protein GDI1678 [Gluconacetobacter diazotrophicus PA1 5]
MTAAFRPIRRLFVDVEDFAAPVRDMDAVVAHADNPQQEPAPEPEPDPDLLTMTQADLDSLREAAFNAGLEKGARDREEVLQGQFASSLSSVAAAFEAENGRRNQLVADAGKSFVATVVDVVRSLTALDGDVLAGMQRDLLSDALAFVAECEGAVTVQCSTADVPRLQALVTGDKIVQIEAVPGIDEGKVRIVSAANVIVIDPEQWRKSVAEKIVAAVTALAERRVDQGVQKA